MASATSLVFNIVGNNRATAALNGASSSVSSLSDKVKKFGLLAAASAATAAAGITAMAVDFTKAAMEDEASAAKLVQTMQKTQGATKEQIKSTEDWITKMGVATGMADDKLRPALSALMIAGRTTAEAQSDVAVAMDIAAAKGLDLETVTKAMAKAAMGNTGALGKLGVATKDAEGNALTYEQVLANVAATMGGASAAAADTTAGRFARLSLVVSEMKESIGYALLPVLTDLAGWFLNKGMPAIQSFSDALVARLAPAVASISAWVSGTLVPALTQLWGWFQEKIVPAVSNLVSQVMGGLSGAFDTIKSKIEENKPQLEQLWSWLVTIANFITDYVVPAYATYLKGALEVAGFAIGRVIDAVSGLVTAAQWMGTAVPAAIEWVKTAFTTAKEWIGQKIDEVVAFVEGLPQSIANATSNIASFLTAPFVDAYYRIVGWVDKILDKAQSIASLGGLFGNGNAAADLGLVPEGRAVGGPVRANTPYIVGERGPELMVPGRSGTVIPNHQLSSGSVVTNNNTFNLYDLGDPQANAAAVGRRLEMLGV